MSVRDVLHAVEVHGTIFPRDEGIHNEEGKLGSGGAGEAGKGPWGFRGGECLRDSADVYSLLSQDLRHGYEKCQYDEFKKRVAKMNELRAAKGGARSN